MKLASVFVCAAIAAVVSAAPAMYCFGDNELGQACAATSKDYVTGFGLPASGFPASTHPFPTACGGWDSFAAAGVASKDGKDAQIMSWGNNGDSKLLGRADAPKESSNTPSVISGTLARSDHPTRTVTPIKICGGENFMALLTEEGDIYALGSKANGESGQISNSDEVVESWTQIGVSNPSASGDDSPYHTFTDMDCGEFHTVALTKAGEAVVWGFNAYHQVFNSDNQDNDAAIGADGWNELNADVPGQPGISRVFASKVATYVLSDEADGYKLYGFGFGGYGVLGANNTDDLTDNYGYQYDILQVASDKSWLEVSAGSEVAFLIERGSQDLYVMGRNTNTIGGMKPGVRRFEVPTKLELPSTVKAAEGWSEVHVLDTFVVAKTKKEGKWYIWGESPYVDGGSGGFLFEPTEFLGLLNRLDKVELVCPGRDTLCFIGDGPNVLLVLAVPIAAAVAGSAAVLCFVYSATKRAMGPGKAPPTPARANEENGGLLPKGNQGGSKRRAPGGTGGSQGSRKGSKGSKGRKSSGSKRK